MCVCSLPVSEEGAQSSEVSLSASRQKKKKWLLEGQESTKEPRGMKGRVTVKFSGSGDQLAD